jgi:hypothetical protein
MGGLCLYFLERHPFLSADESEAFADFEAVVFSVDLFFVEACVRHVHPRSLFD